MIFKMSRVVGVLVVLGATAALGAQSASTDWTQWRGATRDGSVAAFKAPARWPDALTMKWRQEIGLGYSTPIVMGNSLYTFARSGENEAVTAFDANTGKQIWQVSYPAPYTLVKAAAPHGLGPKSTPAYADGRLFTFGISGILSAIDAKTGKLLWQKPAPQVGPTFSTSQSALVDRGLLIVHVGGNDGGALTAFDPASGTVKWQWTGDGPSYGSPIVAEFGGTRQVITFTLDNLVGISEETGELLWLRPYKAPSQVNAGTPIVYRDLVIVSGQDAGITAFRVSRQGGKWVTEDAWKNDDLFMRLTNGVIAGDALFSLSPQNRGQFFFVDAKSGKTLYTGEPRTAENAAIAKAGTLLFVLKADGELLIVDGSNPTTFTPLRRYKVSDAATWAQPAISGNRIFVKDLTTVALWAIE